MKKIVIADDEGMILSSLGALLELKFPEYEIIQIGNYSSLDLLLANESNIVLIILDYNMREYDPDEMMRKYLKITSKLNINLALMSGQIHENNTRFYLQSGLKGVLLKGTDVDIFCYGIAEILDGKVYFTIN
jgi:DNA-binding NarL/FixJ family response regulator